MNRLPNFIFDGSDTSTQAARRSAAARRAVETRRANAGASGRPGAASKAATIAALKQSLAATSSDAVVCEALLVIFARQTADERETHATTHDNGRGFTGLDATLLSSFADQFIKRGRLSEKQMTWLRKKIVKYAGQLVEAQFPLALAIARGGMASADAAAEVEQVAAISQAQRDEDAEALRFAEERLDFERGVSLGI